MLLGTDTIRNSAKKSRYLFDSEEEAEEAVDEAREELEEKIRRKNEESKIAKHVKELKKIERLNMLLEFQTKEEALEMAENDEEREFIEKNFL